MDTESFLAKSAELDDLHARGDYEAAYRVVRQLLDQQRSADLLVRMAKVEQLLDRDDPTGDVSLDSVRAHLTEAHRREPSAVAPLLELGHFFYAVENDPETGLRYFTQARELSEAALREAWIGQLKCLIELGDGKSARAELAALRSRLGPDVDLDELADAVARIEPGE